MARIEISIDDHLLDRVQQAAAAEGSSVSGFIQNLVRPRVAWSDQRAAFEDFLAAARGFGDAESGPAAREGLYDDRIDTLVRRHERVDLHDRHAGFGEERQGEILDSGPERSPGAGSQPAEPE